MKSALINFSVDIQHYLQILKIRWKQRVSTNFWDNPRTLTFILSVISSNLMKVFTVHLYWNSEICHTKFSETTSFFQTQRLTVALWHELPGHICPGSLKSLFALASSDVLYRVSNFTNRTKGNTCIGLRPEYKKQWTHLVHTASRLHKWWVHYRRNNRATPQPELGFDWLL